MEFRLVRESGDFQPADRILDIGSPKLLSLYLAKKLGAEVHSTDVEDYFVHTYSTLRTMEGLSPDRFRVAVEDGRKLSYPNNSFDKVYSVSVIEHIPDIGDSECVREIGRVLAPGGRCMITVPCGNTSRSYYRSGNDFYWAGSSTGTNDGAVFFQRRYSEADLYSRLIEPSGLRLRQLRFVGEKVFTRSERELFEHFPRPVHTLLGPVQPLFSKVLHDGPVDSFSALTKPLCALVVLEKPAV